ncbi:MAG TPA: flagellar basal body P-ring protein FlgI [Geminicoccaceae bacterium]|nr:flagellar basal body P-ring protein FlgI [Geminicoccaceae bacterium]
MGGLALRQRRHLAIAVGRAILAAIALALAATVAMPAAANSRIKDITDFEGVRDNPVVGYGLVVGLNGTGDSLRSSAFTAESLQAMLERLGVSTRGQDLKTKNVAAVMVTATLPPFARQGSRLDVSVSALGDAKSLEGGTLLVTPLYGADGEICAVSQGQLAIGGFVAQGAAESVTQGVSTSARIAAGGIIEREVGFELDQLERIRIALRNPDFTTAERIALAINRRFASPVARVTDPATVALSVPSAYRSRIAALLTDIEQLTVEPDQPARVLVDEQSGIIVMGDDVRISQVAIAQGNLTVRITEATQVSQPNPRAEGDTVVVPRTRVEVEQGGGSNMVVLQEGVSLQELVAGLNALGVQPRDLISILQAIKAAGALQAEIMVM